MLINKDSFRREVELDIATNAGYMIAQERIDVRDSRELVHSVIPEIATKFIQVFDENKHNYLEYIDEYSFSELEEFYKK